MMQIDLSLVRNYLETAVFDEMTAAADRKRVQNALAVRVAVQNALAFVQSRDATQCR
jgi:hypothetical protein